MTKDQGLKLTAAVWVILMAAFAATFNPLLCVAVLVGAAIALTEHAARSRRP